MNTVLNCYLYIKEAVPKVLLEVLKDDEDAFKAVGYAFVSGLIDSKEITKNNAEG